MQPNGEIIVTKRKPTTTCTFVPTTSRGYTPGPHNSKEVEEFQTERAHALIGLHELTEQVKHATVDMADELFKLNVVLDVISHLTWRDPDKPDEATQIGIDFGKDIDRLIKQGKLLRTNKGRLSDAPGHPNASAAAFKRAKDRCTAAGVVWEITLDDLPAWPKVFDGVEQQLVRLS